MKSFIVVCLFGLAAVALARPDDKYTDKYDHVDVPQILNNERLLIKYVNCLVGEGKCTTEGKELLSHIPDALENDCLKCTDIQRERTREVIAFLINHAPAQWERLKAKHDPENKYTKKHEKELKEIKH